MADVLLLLLLLALICFALLQLIRKRSSSSPPPSSSSLPPSPPALPFIGHLHLVGKLPHKSMLELSKKYGELVFLRMGTVNTLIVSSPAAGRQVLTGLSFASRSQTFETEYVGYKGAGLVFAPYGEHWRQARKLCTLELLTVKRVELAQPIRKREMALLLNELYSVKEGSVINLASKLSDFTFNIMLKMVINKSYSVSAATQAERDEALVFKDAIIEMFRVANGIHIASFFPWLKWMDRQVYRIKAVYERLSGILQKEIDEHARNYKEGKPPEDFIDVMLSVSKSERGLGMDAMKALAQDMVGGGTDTAANTVEWALSELMMNPAVLNTAVNELDMIIGRERTMEEGDIPRLRYLQAVVKETLRLHPPITLIPRENTAEACKVGGFTIPAKTRVFVNAYAIGRDESVWGKPSDFDPGRFVEGRFMDVRGQNFELVPFGSGRRMCPGMELGLTTVTFVLGSLLHAFQWRMPEELTMEEHFGLTVARASPLKLVPSPRLPSGCFLVK